MTCIPIADWRRKAQEICNMMPEPLFYAAQEEKFRRVDEIAAASDLVHKAQSLMREHGGALGHGFAHAARVAVDAGAVIYCEEGFGPASDTMVEKCLIAGYLHDVRREEKNHPGKAAEFVDGAFRDLIPGNDLEMIKFAICSHEAFKEFTTVPDRNYMLMADALYDADKFRWGPDNFVYTIWDMAESMSMNPEVIFRYYDKGVEGIIRIRETFRTRTGKRYGPDFIDKGLEIGRKLLDFYRSGMAV